MKTSSKIIIILSLLLIIAVWLGIKFYKKPPLPTNKIEEVAKKQIETEAKQIAKEVSKNGLQQTIVKLVKETDYTEVERLKADLLDTVDALNIARKDLKQITNVAVNLKVENKELKKTVDMHNSYYTYQDNHTLARFRVPNDTTKKATLEMLGQDFDITTTWYNKNSFWKGNSQYMNIYANDPKVTIGGVRTVTVKAPLKKFSLNTQATTSYDFISKDILFGPAISIDMGKFNIKGKYLYDLKGNNPRWVIDGSYSIFGF